MWNNSQYHQWLGYWSRILHRQRGWHEINDSSLPMTRTSSFLSSMPIVDGQNLRTSKSCHELANSLKPNAAQYTPKLFSLTKDERSSRFSLQRQCRKLLVSRFSKYSESLSLTLLLFCVVISISFRCYYHSWWITRCSAIAKRPRCSVR